jgi:hypothetical protein
VLYTESLEAFSNVEKIALAVEEKKGRRDSAASITAYAENLHVA